MQKKNIVAGLLLIVICLNFNTAFPNFYPKKKKTSQIDSVQVSIDYLKYLLEGNDGWVPQSEEVGQNLRGLLHYFEDEKLDSILYKIDQQQKSGVNEYFTRSAKMVVDSLSVPGFISFSELQEQLKRVDRDVKNNVIRDEIAVPEELFENLNQKVRLLKRGESHLLLKDSLVVLPDSLLEFQSISDPNELSRSDYERYRQMDSLKTRFLEQARQQFNNELLQHYIDSVRNNYQDEYINILSKREQDNFSETVTQQNLQLLTAHNDSVKKEVNKKLVSFLDILTQEAEKDSLDFWIYNHENDSTQIWLRKYYRDHQRFFIKNEQKDSLGIRIQNIDKNAIKILIDDGVTFSRFSEKQKRDFEFQKFVPERGLRKVKKLYNISTPWRLGGDGTVGFTQTYLSNWKRGGKSALSTLLVLKGFANYSFKKIKWENNAEIRTGWLKPGDDKIQKNADKFGFTSRFGVSAFKKWYYSAELDFETQFFYGYNYPNRDNPISGFLAPARTFLKLGLDYKPNKNFSLLLSPLTSKTVYVRDTAKIDASKFGIEDGKKRYWEPGLNADVKFKRDLTEDIAYELKYKMFVNYSAPFSKFDINWENNFVMRLNNFINMRMMLHFIYDDNVKFPIYEMQDGQRVEVGKEPKWQMKEFITIGFSYKLNKPIYRRDRVN